MGYTSGYYRIYIPLFLHNICVRYVDNILHTSHRLACFGSVFQFHLSKAECKPKAYGTAVGYTVGAGRYVIWIIDYVFTLIPVKQIPYTYVHRKFTLEEIGTHTTVYTICRLAFGIKYIYYISSAEKNQ